MSLTNEKTLDYYINKLPDDIKHLIYYDYFYYKYLHSLIDNILITTPYSQCLNYKPLLNLFTRYNLIEKKNFVNYLCKKDETFCNIYNTHYIKNHNTFIYFDKLDSLCASWLMFLYK